MGDFWKPHLRGKDRGLGNKEAQHIHTSTHNQTGAHMHEHKYTHVQAHIYHAHARAPRQVLTEKHLRGASWAPTTWQREPRW